jgi:hypothetical protein
MRPSCNWGSGRRRTGPILACAARVSAEAAISLGLIV